MCILWIQNSCVGTFFIWTNKILTCDALECKCNEKGSITEYCNEETGKCLCKTGFTGDKCYDCATGYKNCNSDMECEVPYTAYPDSEYFDEQFASKDQSIAWPTNQEVLLILPK